MGKLYRLTLLVCFLMTGLPNQSRASHLVGAEIAWQYLGSDTFLISAIIERDCNGVPMPDQPFTILPCNAKSGYYINTIKTGGMDITPVCKNYCTRCSESSCDFPSGFENYTFSAKVNLKALDSNCCNFTIVWQACCRNGAITTCPTPGENYYLEANMNRCITPGDNSPVFVNAPLMMAEVNQCLTYTFTTVDPDVDANGFHDSLVYFLDTPFQMRRVPVDFISGYAYNYPIQYYGTSPNDPWVPDCKGFHLDQNTGDLMFKATKEDISQVVVRVEEWGKDASGKPYKKGQTRRDVTFFTSPYTGDVIPSLSGFNGTTSSVQNFCVGQKQCLTIYATDADTGKIVKVTSSGLPSGLSSATLAIDTSSKRPSTIFCLEPDATQVGKSYQFTLNAEDNNCPLVGKTSRTYTINVFATPKANITTSTPLCGNVTFRATPAFNSTISAYTWYGDDGLSGSTPVINHHYSKAGSYYWKLIYSNIYGCTDTVSDVVVIAPYVYISVSPKDTLVCLSKNPVVNLNSTISGGTGPFIYSWTSSNIKLSDSTNALKIPVTKDSTILAMVRDSGGHCTNWDTAHIKASGGITPVTLIPPKDTLTCNGEKVTLIAEATGGDPAYYGYLWKPAGVKHNLYNFIASKAQNQLIIVNDGCTSDSATVHITVRPPLIIHVSKDTAICPGNAITALATGTGGIPSKYEFTWEGSLGTGATKTLSPVSTQNYSVTLSDGCSTPDTGFIKITVYPKPVSKLLAVKTTTMQNQSIQFRNASIGASSYLWKFGDGTTSILDSPLHQYTDTGYFNVTLTTINSNGCLDSTFSKNYIHVLPAFYCYIPNAFTPQSLDSLNLCFEPKGQAISSYTLEVFSRWGNTVYKGNKCWDGTFKGQPLPDGMFIYHIKVTDVYGNTYSYQGPFYLLN